MGLVYYGLASLSHMLHMQVPVLTVGIPASCWTALRIL